MARVERVDVPAPSVCECERVCLASLTHPLRPYCVPNLGAGPDEAPSSEKVYTYTYAQSITLL